MRQGDRLDEALIWEELRPLLELKEEPEAADRAAGDPARRPRMTPSGGGAPPGSFPA